MKKRIVFLTGTRADFGKLKPLMRAVEGCGQFESAIFVTGMHMLSRYGLTIEEITGAGFSRIHGFINQYYGEQPDLVLANTINGLSRYVQEYCPDMLVVHGDRLEALAGAIVGILRNVLVAHIEGGELSGTTDEIVRHAVSKLAHLHFVANRNAAERLLQLGERRETVFVTGSPDIDVMLSKELPDLPSVRARYDIGWPEYGIVLFHPVTADAAVQLHAARELVAALIFSGLDWVVIYPNNDPGSDYILSRYSALRASPRFRLLPSMRFEAFITLLQHARVMVGNSSAGVREAPVFGVPSVNIGSRQHNRYRYESILEVADDRGAIRQAILRAWHMPRPAPSHFFGDGHSTERFLAAIRDPALWLTSKQKQFCDVTAAHQVVMPPSTTRLCPVT